MSFTLGIYKTRDAAEEAVKLWSDVYDDEALSIDFDGSHYRLIVTLFDDPR
jgi:hypothetical protein